MQANRLVTLGVATVTTLLMVGGLAGQVMMFSEIFTSRAPVVARLPIIYVTAAAVPTDAKPVQRMEEIMVTAKRFSEPESLATRAVNSTDSADSARCKLHTGNSGWMKLSASTAPAPAATCVKAGV